MMMLLKILPAADACVVGSPRIAFGGFRPCGLEACVAGEPLEVLGFGSPDQRVSLEVGTGRVRLDVTD